MYGQGNPPKELLKLCTIGGLWSQRCAPPQPIVPWLGRAKIYAGVFLHRPARDFVARRIRFFRARFELIVLMTAVNYLKGLQVVEYS